MTGKPCWVLVAQLCLWYCFSCTDFEEMIAGLTWRYTLPPGWHVEWDGPSASVDTPPAEWCHIRASLWHFIHIASRRTFTLPLNNELWRTLLVKTSVVLYFVALVCNKFKFRCISQSCMKCHVLYSLGSPSCELFVMIPVSVALIGTLPMEPRSDVRVGSALPSNNG